MIKKFVNQFFKTVGVITLILLAISYIPTK